MEPYRFHVLVCNDKFGCTAAGGDSVVKKFRELLAAKNIKADVKVNRMSCTMTHAHFGSVAVIIFPDGVWYGKVSENDVEEIVNEHLLNGRIVERLFYRSLDKISDQAI